MNKKIKEILKYFIPSPIYQVLIKIKSKIYRVFEKIRNATTLIFQVHITYHCNLKCRCCSHFSPIADERFLDANSFDRDLKRLADLGGKRIRQLDLLGGEPLLHPQINTFLATARRRLPRTRIVLFTNGILLGTMRESFWKVCSENNIVIAISHYPSIKLDIAALDNTADKYGVTIAHNNLDKEVFFGHFKFDLDGASDGELNARRCGESKVCHCLEDGKMYLCFIPALIGVFNEKFGKQIPVTEFDYIDIYSARNISEVIRFLKSPTPFCNYCAYERGELVKWGISEKTIDEWT